MAAIAAPIIDGINAALRRAAAVRANTVVVAPPTVQVKPHGEPLFDAAYHSAAADRIAAVALAFIEREMLLHRLVVR
jgi:hypothetical protein